MAEVEGAAPPMDDAILDIRNLRARYGGRIALAGINYRMARGERVAVTGPNGAGKSTLFRVIAGLHPPSSGTVTVHGHEPGEGACVAYVQQRSSADWSFPVSVENVVMMGRAARIGLLRRPGPEDHLRVAQALDTVGLRHLAGRRISDLSGGQQQRMFIARALAQQAELVLMDEPMTGLDPRSRRDISGALDQLRTQGVGVMVATHDLQFAAEGFERVLLLNRTVIADGPPEQVITEANLLAAYGGRVRLLDPERSDLLVSDAGCDDPAHG